MEEVEHLGNLALNKLRKKIQKELKLIDKCLKADEEEKAMFTCSFDTALEIQTEVWKTALKMVDEELEKLNNEH